MAVEITYADNKFVVIGGTEGSPGIMEDVYAYAYNNLLYVDDIMYGTPIIESPVEGNYTIRADIDFGDGTTPTYFQSKNEEVYFADDKAFTIKSNATLEIGDLYGDWGIDGSMWSYSADSVMYIIGNGQTTANFYLYASHLHSRSTYATRFYAGTVVMNKAQLSNEGYSNTELWAFRYLESLIIKDVYATYTKGIQFNYTPDTVKGLHIHYTMNPLVMEMGEAEIIVKEPRFTSTHVAGHQLRIINANNSLIIINPETNIISVRIQSESATAYERYTFNLHIRDKDGNNLSGVTCLLEDTDDNESFSVETAGDGTITEQTVDYKKWEGTDETLTEYTPHKLTLSKAGYETLVIDEITMDEKKNLEFELLPALAVSDVRIGTSFGENKTGTLALNLVIGSEISGKSTVGTVESQSTIGTITGE